MYVVKGDKDYLDRLGPTDRVLCEVGDRVHSAKCSVLINCNDVQELRHFNGDIG